MKSMQLSIVCLFALLCIGAAGTYYPFEQTNITQNKSMFISIEGTKGNYADEPVLYLSLDNHIDQLFIGSCKDWPNHRICYTDAKLNLSNKQGKYHRVFGQIPALTLDIEDLKKEVQVSLSTNQSVYFPSQNAQVTFTLDNQGIDISKGTLYVASSQPIVLGQNRDFDARSHTLFTSDLYRLKEEEKKVHTMEFVVTDAQNITFTAWVHNEDYLSEKKELIVKVKNPLDVSLSIKDDTLGYDDWFEGELKVTQNAPFVLLKEMILDTDLLFNWSEKNYVWEDEYMQEGFTLPFKIHARSEGEHYVRVRSSYEFLQRYDGEKTIPLHVSIYRPSVLITIDEEMEAYGEYSASINFSKPKHYHKRIQCILKSPTLGEKELTRFGMQQHSISFIVPKIIEEKKEVVQLRCDLHTIYDEIVQETYTRNVTFVPTEYIDINKSLVQDAITQKERAEEIKTIVDSSKKPSLVGRILAFFGL